FKSVVWGRGCVQILEVPCKTAAWRSQNIVAVKNIGAVKIYPRARSRPGATVLHARVSKPPGSIIGRDDGGRDEPAAKTIGHHSVPRCRARSDRLRWHRSMCGLP